MSHQNSNNQRDAGQSAGGSVPSTPPVRSRRRRLRVVMIAITILVGGLGGVGYWLFVSIPPYWIENQHFLRLTKPDVLQSMAEDFEVKILRLQSYQGPLPSETESPDRGNNQQVRTATHDTANRKIQMTITQANAWLATKLDKWLHNQNWNLPDQISQPMVHLEGNDVVLVFKWNSPKISNTFSIVLGISMSEQGMIRIQRKAIRCGRLPVPFTFLVKHLNKEVSRSNRPIITWMTHLTDGTPQEPVFPYAGDATRKTQLRLLKYRFEPNLIELSLRVETTPDDHTDIAPPTADLVH